MTYMERKLYLGIIIGLIILVVFFWLIVSPLFLKVRELSHQYLDGQKLLLKLEQRESFAKELEKEYKEKEENILDIRRVFIGPEETVGFIYSLEKIAKETNNAFEIKTVSPFEESEDSSISFRITLWGNYPNLMEFIANLENAPYPPYRMIEISSMDIGRIEDPTKVSKNAPNLDEGDIETVLNIKIFTKWYED